MKPFRVVFPIFLFVGISLLFFSCVSPQKTDSVTQATPPAETAGASVETAISPESPVKIIIPLVTKETFLFPDGSVDEYRVYTYADSGVLPLSEELFSADGARKETVEYRYEGGLLVRKNQTGGSGTISAYHVYEYGPGGLVTVDTMFGPTGLQQMCSRYDYDALGRRIKWSVFDAQNSLLSYSTYQYQGQGETLTRVENYSPSGTLEEYFIFQYSDGLKIRDEQYNAAKKLVAYTVYEYVDGLLSSESFFNGSKALQRKVVYERDEKGVVAETVHFDSRGQVRERVKKEYIFREIESATAEER